MKLELVIFGASKLACIVDSSLGSNKFNIFHSNLKDFSFEAQFEEGMVSVYFYL